MSTQPSTHPSFLGSYRLQLVAGTINTANKPFLHETFSNCRTQKHLTHFITYVLQIHILLGISQPSLVQADLLVTAEQQHRQTSGCPAPNSQMQHHTKERQVFSRTPANYHALMHHQTTPDLCRQGSPEHSCSPEHCKWCADFHLPCSFLLAAECW